MLVVRYMQLLEVAPGPLIIVCPGAVHWWKLLGSSMGCNAAHVAVLSCMRQLVSFHLGKDTRPGASLKKNGSKNWLINLMIGVQHHSNFDL